jgi:DNA segregation ATPase FtsK/SpoIIIE-like protein
VTVLNQNPLNQNPLNKSTPSQSTPSGSTFTRFTDPYISDIGVTASFAERSKSGDSYLDWNGALDGLSQTELDLLLRTVELVVQAQTFSRERLQFALRISPESAVQMTHSLELLGVIAAGEPNAQRRVLVSVRTLPVLLAKLLSSDEYEHTFQSPQEQRVAS